MPDKVQSADMKSTEFGEPHTFDPGFRGPVKKRSCTDVLCLILFIAFLIGWVILAIVAAFHGNPERLVYPTDSRGRVCGRDPAVQDRPYLLFFDLTRCASPKVPFTGCPTPQVCVKECPKENWFYLPGKSVNKSKLYCKEGTDLSKNPQDLIQNQDCAAYYVHSQNIGGRCIPRVAKNTTIVRSVGDEISSHVLMKSMKFLSTFLNTQQVAEGVMEDVRRLWPFILIGCVIAMVVSFLWILLLRLIATIMVWLSLFIFTGLCGFGAYYTLNKYLNARKNMDQMDMTDTESEFTRGLSKIGDRETTWLVFFIITICIFITCLLVLIFLRKRIKLAIALINEASKAVGSIMSTLFFPLIPYLMHLVFLAIFCIVALLLASTGSPVYKVVCEGDCSCALPIKENDTCHSTNFSTPGCPSGAARCQFYSYESHPVMPNLHIYNMFALFWTMCFVSAFCEMVLAGAFSSWYWSYKKPDDVPSAPVLASMGRTFRYHLGTLAFGSLIIAIVRMIRMIFEYIDYKLKKYTDSKVAKVLMCLCRCCLWCLEKFLRFINRYTGISIMFTRLTKEQKIAVLKWFWKAESVTFVQTPNTDARKVYVSISCDLRVLRRPVDTVMTIDAAVKFKNCLIGPQNAFDVQLSTVNHLKELLTKFDPLVLVAIVKGVNEAQMIRNAYIYCAIYGTNFCNSARKSFSLLMRNVVRVVVLDKVTDFLLLIGKLVVTGGMALLAFFFFSGEIVNIEGHLPQMNYYLTPVILIAVATFFISSAFFDVYNMAVDTLFFCFLEDSERNDGSEEKPYYMSKNLSKILNKSNKLKEEE